MNRQLYSVRRSNVSTVILTTGLRMTGLLGSTVCSVTQGVESEDRHDKRFEWAKASIKGDVQI